MNNSDERDYAEERFNAALLVEHDDDEDEDQDQGDDATPDPAAVACGWCDQPATHHVIGSTDDVICVPCARAQTSGRLRDYIRPLGRRNRGHYARTGHLL